MNQGNDLEKLSQDFENSKKVLLALGDENRQHMILEMMKMGKCSGVRVNEIVEKTHLSRASVSHHLKILKDAGIIKMRRESTKNYYYFDPHMDSFQMLIDVLQSAIEITKNMHE